MITELKSLKMKSVMERNLVTLYFVIAEWLSPGNSTQIKITGVLKKEKSQ